MWRNCRDLWSCYAAVSVAALGRPVLSNPLNCDWATNVRGNSTFWSTVPSCAPSCVCICVCVSIETNPKVFQIVFICCLFVFAHFVYCVFSLSLPVLCTHHKLGFYISSISQFCTNISKLLTQVAQRTRDLLEFVFIISQTKRERRAHEERTVCVACSKATESTQSLSERPTRTQLRSQRQPVGRSRLHDDTHSRPHLCKRERATTWTRFGCILERDKSNNKEATAATTSPTEQQQQ